MNNTVRNEAQRYGIFAIIVAIAVLVIFFLLAKSGIGNAGATPDAAGATSSGSMSSGMAPSPNPT